MVRSELAEIIEFESGYTTAIILQRGDSNTSSFTLVLLSILLISVVICYNIRKSWLPTCGEQFAENLNAQSRPPDVTWSEPLPRLTSPRTLAALLSANEPFQHVDEDVIEDYARHCEVLTYCAGKTVPVRSYGLCFILTGSLHVYTNSTRAQSTPPLKCISAHHCATPMLLLLSVLLRTIEGDATTSPSMLSSDESDFCFKVVENVTIAILSKQALQELVRRHLGSTLRIFDNVCRRVYFVTLPFANRYFEYGSSILQYETKMSYTHAELVSWAPQIDSLMSILGRFDFRQLFSPTLDSVADHKSDHISHYFHISPTCAEKQRACEVAKDTRLPSKSNAGAPSRDLPTAIPENPPPAAEDEDEDGATEPLTPLERLENSSLGLKSRSIPELAYLRATRRLVSLMFSEALGLNVDSSILRRSPMHTDRSSVDLCDEIDLVYLRKGDSLACEGTRLSGIFMLVEGAVKLGVSTSHTSVDISRAGSLLGFSALLHNNRSLVDITVKQDSCLAFIPRQRLHQLTLCQPHIRLSLAKRMVETMPENLKLSHFIVDWMRYDANSIVYAKGSKSTSFCVVSSGRLRCCRSLSNRGDPNYPVEYGVGQSFGAEELYADLPRSDTVYAIRQSYVIQVQKLSMEGLAHNDAAMGIRFLERIAKNAPALVGNSTNRQLENPDDSTIQTVVIVSVDHITTAGRFASQLLRSINALGVSGNTFVPMLDRECIEEILPEHSTDAAVLENYLNQVEDNARLVLYVTDRNLGSVWSMTCLARAEFVLFIASCASDPRPKREEIQLVNAAAAAKKRLVLMHNGETTVRDGLTHAWSIDRPWLTGQPWHVSHDSFTDHNRVVRRILGRSIALVLGGGGARGIAHLGILKALEERDIPIDIIGGTSIGAFIGAAFARMPSASKSAAILRQFSRSLRPWQFLLDMTYPWISVTTGRRFNYLIRSTFGHMKLDDTWIECYCAVTRVSNGVSSKIITSGRAWEVVRASMSVLGFVPPLNYHGELIFDGCYSSNIPISFAATLKARHVFAIDVSPDVPITSRSWGSELSTWDMLVKRFTPWRNDVPRYSSLIDYLTQGVAQADLQMARNMPGCFYTSVPVGRFQTTAFQCFDEIYKIGYDHGKCWLEELEKSGHLKELCL